MVARSSVNITAMKIRSSTLLLLAFAISCTGCAIDIKPWQRGNLAKNHMAVEPDALHRIMREQVVTSNESASGGYSVVGGGCGCN